MMTEHVPLYLRIMRTVTMTVIDSTRWTETDCVGDVRTYDYGVLVRIVRSIWLAGLA